MAAKSKSNPLNGMHTAGIFSDLSVDGPEIGTLVVIIDRARHLPNRKTIGKQDPYCAARLGKEAKKTTTDIRGGQTPKWDQELRFVVHDSPDYYQLKVSVFNDDKKTDLIGENWVDLREIVVRGGGQNDLWQQLACRGKYAGEVRIELTYYDSRPKPEKQVAKAKPMPANTDEERASVSSRTPVKRRPLPSDPVTGQVPASSLPDHVQTPPRAQPVPPVGFIPNQSPLQAVEYGTPPPQAYHQQDRQSSASLNGGHYTTPSPQPQYHHRAADSYDSFSARGDDWNQSPQHHSQQHDRSEHRVPYHSGSPSYDPQHGHEHRRSMPVPMADDDRPPPPPVHRSRNNSGNSHDTMGRPSFDIAQHKATPPLRQEVLRTEAHRQSISSGSAYPGRPTYRPFDSAPEIPNTGHYQDTSPDPFHQTPPRHHSYDSSYDSHQRSMQPTVEDAPESPTPNFRASGSRVSPYDDRGFDQCASPAPLNLSGRGSAASGHYNPAGMQNPAAWQQDQNNFNTSPSPVSTRDYSHSAPPQNPQPSYDHRYPDHANELDGRQMSEPRGNYGMAPLPPSLVPGVDPSFALEMSHRIHEERRHERRYTQPLPPTQSMAISTTPRGRQMVDYSFGSDPNSQSHTPGHHDRRSGGVTYSSNPTTPNGSYPRGTSPVPPSQHHTIKRKSVSPAPPPSEERRLSGVPFGPDSYDALNPSIVSSNESALTSTEKTNAEGKIITHDGREVDPSDHLPMDTWAPEPEPKKPTTSLESRSRPMPGGAQPLPPSGRRQIRVQARPQSMASPQTYINSDVNPSPPASAGRNRLQKKAYRVSAAPSPMNASGTSPLGAASSRQRNSTPPRALLPSRSSTFDNENFYEKPMHNGGGYGGERASFSGPPIPAKVPLMSGVRGAGGYGGGNGYGNSMGYGGAAGGDDWALMQEMSRIDIGSGRARRHGGY